MKRSLCSLIMATGLLIATSGAWALSTPFVVDNFERTGSADTDAGDGTHPTPSSTQGLTTGVHTDLSGVSRVIAVANATIGATTTTTAVSNTPAGKLDVATGDNSDGRVQLHYSFAATSLIDTLDAAFRIEIQVLDRFLTAVLTICEGGGFGVGTCYTDKYNKPAPSDPGFHTKVAPVFANTESVGTTTGVNDADHFLYTGHGPGGVANFSDRAIPTTAALIAITTCLDPTGTVCDIGTDFNAGNLGNGAVVATVLDSATDIYLTIGIDLTPASGQSTDQSIDPQFNCLEIVNGNDQNFLGGVKDGVNDGPTTTTLGGFPNGKVVGTGCHATAVPEPATLSLMGLGIVALAVGATLRRRVRKA